MLKQLIARIPIVGPTARTIYRRLVRLRTPEKLFVGSERYWEQRYQSGGNSGAGSYHRLAAFKADVLNTFVRDHGVTSVIEFGCGDGNQVGLADYPSYLGLDVSARAVSICADRFSDDATKSFKTMADHDAETADLSLSLDVIYHLVEDPVFEEYMRLLFDAAQRYVIVYASNTDENPQGTAPHVRHRQFDRWIERYQPDWYCAQRIENKYPFDGDNTVTSFADFYIYAKD